MTLSRGCRYFALFDSPRQILEVQGSQLGKVPQNVFYRFDKAVVFGTVRNRLQTILVMRTDGYGLEWMFTRDKKKTIRRTGAACRNEAPRR